MIKGRQRVGVDVAGPGMAQIPEQQAMSAQFDSPGEYRDGTARRRGTHVPDYLLSVPVTHAP